MAKKSARKKTSTLGRWVKKKLTKALTAPPKSSGRAKQPIRRASLEWSKEGERLVPEVQIQPPQWNHYTDEDVQTWQALLQGTWVRFTAWPDEIHKLEELARAEALRIYGVYTEGLVIEDIQPVDDNARAALA
jgi:hypothetical protein